MATFGASPAGEKEGGFTFGSNTKGQVSFGTTAAAGSKPFSLGGEGSSAETPALFGGGEAQPFGGGSTQPTAEKVEKFGEGGKEEGDDAVEQAESTQEFAPVVQLEEVEVKTMEEDEEIVFKMRARLFRFAETLLNKGSGKKEWIERGVGEVKLLKHRENQKIRLLMRQERTMKVIANHVADPRISLKPNVGNDKSWVWSAFDFSDGELVEEVFAVRFANADNAGKFKDAFVDAQESMKVLFAGEDAGPDPEADDAANALANLKTNDASADDGFVKVDNNNDDGPSEE